VEAKKNRVEAAGVVGVKKKIKVVFEDA